METNGLMWNGAENLNNPNHSYIERCAALRSWSRPPSSFNSFENHEDIWKGFNRDHRAIIRKYIFSGVRLSNFLYFRREWHIISKCFWYFSVKKTCFIYILVVDERRSVRVVMADKLGRICVLYLRTVDLHCITNLRLSELWETIFIFKFEPLFISHMSYFSLHFATYEPSSSQKVIAILRTRKFRWKVRKESNWFKGRERD